jgi:STE24 endopeptidase
VPEPEPETVPADVPAGPDRRLSAGVAIVGAVAFVALAVALVPWHWVPGGHYLHVSADEVFTAPQIARGEHYSAMQRHLGWASYALALAVALVLGLTRAGRALLARVPGPWWCRVLLGSLVLVLVGTLVTLPFDARAHHNAVAAGLSRQGWGGWWRDHATALLVTWVPTAVALLVLVALARRAPRSWPAWAAVVVVVLGTFFSWVYPVVVEPMFNSFRPMPAGALRTDIMALAAREHVHVSDVLVADASRRTTTLNAYVSGFGNTRRVVVYDNLLRKAPQREVLVVVAHELGHAHHQDVLTGTALGVSGGVVGVGLLGLLLRSPRLLRRSGATGPADPAVLPLALALVAVGTFVASPVQNAISRDVEARADRASLQATGDLDAFVALQRRLAVSSLADPTPPPWSQLWFGTHPTALQRIGIARALERSGTK